MRKALLIVIGLAVGVLAGVVVRTLRISGSKQPVGAPIPVDHALASRAAQHLGQAVRIQTVLLNDTSQTNAALDAMYDWIQKTYPRVFATLTRELFGRSVMLTWKGTDSAAAPLVLMAHMDVVPVEPGTEQRWARGSFSGDISGGYVWGRGTLDDKENVVGELEAVENLISAGFTPRRTVILCFGQDEETFGSGARSMSAALKSRNTHPLMVVDEGGAVISGAVPGLSRPLAGIGIAEKGYVSVELVAESPGGHSSMPPMQTATGIVATAVAKLEAHQMPARLDGPLAQSIETLAPELNIPSRVAVANLWLVGPFAKSYLARSPETNALIRTTTAATIFEAGVKDNVLPARARAVVNFRLIPHDSIAAVVEHVNTVIGDSRIRVRPLGGSDPSPVADINSPAYKLIERTVHETVPDAVVAPFVMIAATDSRHFTALTPNVFRFTPLRLTRADTRRVHGTDERVSVDNLGEVVSFYTRLVRNADRP